MAPKIYLRCALRALAEMTTSVAVSVTSATRHPGVIELGSIAAPELSADVSEGCL